MKDIYFGYFSCDKDIASSFRTELSDDIDVLLAAYSDEDYSGDAFVVFIKDDKLYEVNGSHCSCMGLEDQWEPEETTFEALEHRMTEGYLCYHFRDEVRARLEHLIKVKDLLFEDAV